MPSPRDDAPLPLARLLGHAADAVAGVRAGRSLTEMLAQCPLPARAGTQALAFHAMRWLGGATVVRGMLAPKAPPPAVDALLTTALALLWPPEPPASPPYADHTLVDQAVTAARQRVGAAAGFVNAVLRRFVRERDALVREAVRRRPEAAYQHPAWWIERVRHDWPAQWASLLHAANRRPPMTLRVNARRGDAEGYLPRLAAEGQAATVVGPHTLVLHTPCAVTELPGFDAGDVSVQDAAAQLASPLLLGRSPPWTPAGMPPGAAVPRPLAPGARVLDACAAPGGKTAHLLELADLDLWALDHDALRLQRVDETLQRLQLRARLLAADAGNPATWWDGRPFDAVLLDAPCTASGIVRRHPDVRWLRRPGDVAALARQQARLLDALWPLVAPGGRLLYATCSIFRAEGQAQIDAFLQRQPAGAVSVDSASPGHLIPLADNAAQACGPAADPDGFFYALLHKP